MVKKNKNKTYKKTYSFSKKYKKFFSKKSNIANMVIFSFLVLFGIVLFFMFYFLYVKIILSLPDVKDLKKIQISEASIIYDRTGGELYKIYDENRIYINYEDISKNMINAIVAGEDKRFWTTPGYDSIGIIRAVINGLKNGNRFKGTSGITQQLAKIIYLTKERTIKRKIRELYLSIQLSQNFDKKDILEIYLNKIFFGGNSYGIEQASKTFYGKKAIELNVLEASILASLPKAPTGLSPYNHKDKLMGYIMISNNLDEKDTYKLLKKDLLEKNKDLIAHLIKILNDLKLKRTSKGVIEVCGLKSENIRTEKFNLSNDGCVKTTYSNLLNLLNSLYYKNYKYKVEYKTGRKDYILGRMLEDRYIDFSVYKKSILDGLGFEFKKYRDNIKYPYFVMYVKDYLVKKYSEDVLKKGGLRIYTSLNPELQDLSENILRARVKINNINYGARNAAMTTIDNKTGEILTFVGGTDYFDKDNLGYNNMLLSSIQVGSTFKPFVYALAMLKNNYVATTLITDNKVVFPGGYRPHNSDKGYLGRMTLSKALNYSRNIPAIKLYYAAGLEDEIIKFLKGFGVNSLEEFKIYYKNKYNINYNYGPPMALGTAQMTALELAEAYTVFPNLGIKRDLRPILKIYNSKGILLKDFTIENKGKRALDEWVAKEINFMLTDYNRRPKNRNNYLTIPNAKIAAKTGTSTIQYKADKWSKDSKGLWYKKTIIVPRNMWTVGYTSDITTVVWAGNTSGSGLKNNAYGITGAAPIMKDFMKNFYK